MNSIYSRRGYLADRFHRDVEADPTRYGITGWLRGGIDAARMKKLIREKEDKMTGHKWTAEQKEKFLKTAEAKRVLRKEESGKSILAEIAHNKALEDLDRSSQAEKMAMNQDACLKMIDPQVRGLPSREIRLITIFCLKCGHQMQLNPDEFQK